MYVYMKMMQDVSKNVDYFNGWISFCFLHNRSLCLQLTLYVYDDMSLNV